MTKIAQMSTLRAIIIIIILSYSLNIFAQDDSTFMDIANAYNIVKIENKNEIQVVSASRTIKKIEDLPVTIYVITREEILYNGYTTLVDVLKQLPGVRISQPGSGELGEIFSMRGYNGNIYTKIMVNGLPVKPSVTIGMPIEAQLPIRQAERIEIIFGPSSAVYGADAAAGVINIITKKAERGVFSQADISLGHNGYSYVNFNAGGKAGKNEKILKYSFFGSKSSIDNMNIFKDSAVYKPTTHFEKLGISFTLPDGNTYKPTQLTEEILQANGLNSSMFLPSNYEGSITMPEIRNIPSESQIVGLELKYKNFTFSVENMSRKTHSSIGRSSFFYKYNNPENYIGDKINRVCFNYEKKIEKFTSSTNLFFLNYAQDNYSNFGVTFVEYADKLYQYSFSNDAFLEQMLTFSHKNIEIVSGVSMQLSAGLPYTDYSVEPFDTDSYIPYTTANNNTYEKDIFGFNPLIFQNYAAFLQIYYVYNRLSIMGGARIDYNTMYNKSSINPRGAILYKINNKTSFRFSYGKAFKAPSPNIMYNSLSYKVGQNLDSTYYALIPNKNLKPELFQAYEIGIRRKLFKNIFVDITAYQNDTYHQIINTYVDAESLGYQNAANPASDPARTYINSDVAEIQLYGADLYITINNIISSIKLNANMGFSFSRANQILPDTLSFQEFKHIPISTGKIKLSMQPSKRFYFNALAYWSSKTQLEFDITNMEDMMEIEGFFDLDIYTGFKFNKNITAFVKIINLFDTEYSGINATGHDIDLNYNPQLGRNIRFGMTFDIN